MRVRSIAMMFGLCAFGGCTTDFATPPNTVLVTPMQVPIDYYPHRTLNPPPKRPSGLVSPADPASGRERDFGPESQLPSARLETLADALESIRAVYPQVGSSWVALAKRHGPKVARVDPRHDNWLGADSTDPQPESDRRETREDRVNSDDPEGGYRLNFEDAEVKDVLQAVLGKVLKLNYTIAPNVIGRITISSAAPQSKTELLSTMETVLAGQGLSLTKTGNLYRVAPLAPGAGTIDKTGTGPGFGVSVIPIEFTSVAAITKLLTGFIVEADGIRIDTTRNAVIVRGPAPRREEIVRAIKTFDGDWMHQQSVSVFELRRSRPEDVIGELTRIFDADTNGDSAGIIQFKAIKRLRSIMVISKNDRLVRRAASWIRRLDHQDLSATDSVFIYRPRYRDAKELARTVNSVFGQDQGDNGSGNGASGQDQQGQSGADSNQNRTIGTSSSASFAGALTAPGGGQGGGIGGPGGGQGGFGANQSGFGTAGGSQSPGSSRNGSGLQGAAADPIEAGQGQGRGRGRLTLKADTSNNTIIAYTDGETYAKVQSVLQQLDLPPLQVAISVVVAEVQLNDELKYGVQFYFNKKAGSLSLSQTASTVLSTQTGFNLLVNSATTPDLLISALDSVSKVHILSTPSIVTMENKPATFEVGNQVPIVTQQATSTLTAVSPTLNQVQYLDTGIILKITPRVGQNGDVAMDLDQVISNVIADPTVSGPNLTPTISKRHISSNISVRSGQNILLAGLINDNRSQQKGQVPFIGAQLGDIFGNKDNTFTRSELVVFIRPVIIRDGKDATAVAEEMKSRLHALDITPPPVYK